MSTWVEALARSESDTPRAVLLVGGPGNGKTEAVETTIHALDSAFGLGGSLAQALGEVFNPPTSQAVPRRAIASLERGKRPDSLRRIAIVQDASVTEAGSVGRSPADYLIADLAEALKDDSTVYLACVNRGILDDALVAATDTGDDRARELLSAIVGAVGLSPDSPSCWPLQAFPSIAVWPMDVESLVGDSHDGMLSSPAATLLDSATAAERWNVADACPAGTRCPFCRSREQLEKAGARESLLRILQLFELGTGKRWSFRDLFTLTSYLLAGSPQSMLGTPLDPCDWAARLIELEAAGTGRPEVDRLCAPYLLVAAQYQHALFGQWARPSGWNLVSDLKELKLDRDATLLGLHHFIRGAQTLSVPATLAPQLLSLVGLLDPALANPDNEVALNASTTIVFRDLDARFSHSVDEGLEFIARHRCLTPNEHHLLKRLSRADEILSSAEVRRRRPAIAARVQRFVRDFACRLVRRTLGVRAGVVREQDTLTNFQRVVDGNDDLMHDAVKQVEALLNNRERFVVSLNTTFGEPLPPLHRQAVLTTAKQRVRPREVHVLGRPKSTLRFLAVGGSAAVQGIPLTYELFRSVQQLKSGMLPASLPRTVLALLDTTRARLAGKIVRDEDVLDGSEIRIGTSTEVIVRELQRFLIRNEAPLES